MLDCNSVILEAESLVFIMDHSLPAPDGEAHFLPEWNFMVVVIIIFFKSHCDRHFVKPLVVHFLVLLELLIVCFIIESVLDFKE